MATLQGKAVKNTYRQVLQIGANNVGVSASLQPVQDGAGVNTALSLSTIAATVNGDLTVTGDLIITGGGLQIKELIDDTVAALIKNGTGITWTYNDAANSLTGNFTGTTSVVPEGSNLYYTQGRFDSAFAAKSTTNLAEGTNLYFTTARGNANFSTNLAASDTDDLAEGATNLYYTNTRARTALSVTGGTGLSYDNTTGVFNLAAIPNASLTNSSITINGQAVSLGGSVTLTTTNIGEGTNLYWTTARGNANFATNLAASTTTNLAEGTNLYYTQARFDTAFSNKSTTNLAEGTNLYYTQARFNSALAAKTTTDLAEGTNLYYTDARARLALSSSATGLTYANNSGVFSLTAGYAIPTTVKLGQYDTAYNRSIVSAAVTGTTTKTLSLTQQDANVVSATWTDLGITTINGTANQIATTTVGNTTTVAFTNDVTMPNNLIVSGNLTINGTATYVNTQSISSKDPLFEVANDNNTTDAVDIGYYGRYYDTPQTRVEFTGLFRDASDAGKFKFFTGLVDEPTNVVNTTGTGYTVGTLVANFEGNLAGTANAANQLSTARTIAASGDATWSVSFDGSANVSAALTLANTGVTATTYGTSTSVPTIAVDGKGRITSASNTNITFPVTTVNGFAGTVVLTTSDVAEGTNQYFTTARAQAAITGGASSVVTSDLTASRALVSDGSGKIAASATTTTTEIGYLAGVTSALQTQLNGKLNLTGGTLTGGLTGTTGSFSGILTTPQVKAATSAGLSINANSGTQVADFGAGGSANITFFGGLSGTSANFTGNVLIASSNSTLTLKPTIVSSGGSILFRGTLTSGSEQFQGFIAAVPLDSNNNTSDLSFNTYNAGTIVEGLRIKANGNVGIATNSPGYDGSGYGSIRYLSINNASNTGTSLEIASGSTANDAYIGSIDFINTANTGAPGAGRFGIAWIRGYTTNPSGTTTGGGYLSFGTKADGGSNGEKMRITSVGNVGIGTSSPESNSQLTLYGSSFSQLHMQNGTTGTGSNGFRILMDGNNLTMTNKEAGYWAFETSDTERMRITSAGDVGIGNSGFASTKLTVTGKSNTSSDFSFVANNSSNGNLFLVRNDGIIFAPPTYNTTTASLSNMVIFSDGSIGRSTASSERFKENIKDWHGNGLNTILALKAKTFTYKADYYKNPELEMLGLIAEEVAEVSPFLAEYENDDRSGQVENVRYATIVVPLIKAIQEQQAQIEELKAMIAAK
jgi:hypothetical protein